MTEHLRIGSLCSGYGGLDMAAEAVTGAATAWHADPMPAAATVLAHRYPGVPNHGDLTTTDWASVEPVDIITAGWPCQPWSNAGLRKGAEDARAIWPAIAGAIRRLRPGIVLLENVRAIIPKGELARAVGDLADIGYDVEWMCLRASDVGAPHRRERCFIAAVRDTDCRNPDGWAPAGLAGQAGPAARSVTDTDQSGLEGREPAGGCDLPARSADSDVDWGVYTDAVQRWERILGRVAPDPTQSSKRGTPQLAPRFVEWMMGLPEGWVTDVPGPTRAQQLTLLGNGVVPQQAEAAYRLLLNRTSASRITCDSVTPSASAAALAASHISSDTRTVLIGVCTPRCSATDDETRVEVRGGVRHVLVDDQVGPVGDGRGAVTAGAGHLDAVVDGGGTDCVSGCGHEGNLPHVYTRGQIPRGSLVRPPVGATRGFDTEDPA